MNDHRYAAMLQRRWAANAKRDERYNLKRAHAAKSQFLQKVYSHEAALDRVFAEWRLKQAAKYLR